MLYFFFLGEGLVARPKGERKIYSFIAIPESSLSSHFLPNTTSVSPKVSKSINSLNISSPQKHVFLRIDKVW